MISLNFSNFFKTVDKTEFDRFVQNQDINHVHNTLRTWAESDKIGFINLPSLHFEHAEIKQYIANLPSEIDTFLLIGIGGSSLGPITIYEALKQNTNGKKFYCLENTDPDKTSEILGNINPKRTLVNVISKSGGTTETMVNFFRVYSLFSAELGKNCDKHFVFTTDPNDGLLNVLAKEKNISCFHIPKNVGGRFSVLTPVGLLMAEFLGLNIEKLNQGALDYSKHVNKENNSTLDFALIHFFLSKEKNVNISVLMPYASRMKELTNWFKQLWAESIGKTETVGQTPVSAIGAVDQHSLVQLFMEGPKDKLISFIKVQKFYSDETIQNPFELLPSLDIYNGKAFGDLLNIQLDATAYALTKNGRFNLSIEIPEISEYYIGQLFYFFELATAYSGILNQINPFDQPGVESGKIATKALLGDPSLTSVKDEILSSI